MGGIVPLAKGINTIAGAVNNVGRAVGTIQTLSGSGSQRESQNLALRQLQENRRCNNNNFHKATLWSVSVLRH